MKTHWLLFVLGSPFVVPSLWSQEQPSLETPPPIETPEDAPEPDSIGRELLDAMIAGKVKLNLRLRTEIADANGARRSEAYTSRLRLGYQTGEYRGFHLFAEMEDVRAADYDLYNAAGLNRQGNHTVIADPEGTELNQGYVHYELDVAKSVGRVGRQRVILNDARFVGNVGWRQNEQTFDALLLENHYFQDLDVKYVYFWEVNRIFGDERSTAFPNQRLDFESDSHAIDVAYSGFPIGTLTGFAYFLDFSGPNSTASANSSNTYGARLAGQVAASEDIDVNYVLSYAHQVDGEDNPTGYRAHYFLGEAELALNDIGSVVAGYENLGTHHGRAQFRTPLATAHKFNGWADAFLDNGGPQGLQDFYFGAAPDLPWDLKGRAVYHKFNDADGGGDLGWEFDASVSKRLTDNVDALVKYAYFDGKLGVDADIYRFWMMLTFNI